MVTCLMYEKKYSVHEVILCSINFTVSISHNAICNQIQNTQKFNFEDFIKNRKRHREILLTLKNTAQMIRLTDWGEVS